MAAAGLWAPGWPAFATASPTATWRWTSTRPPWPGVERYGKGRPPAGSTPLAAERCRCRRWWGRCWRRSSPARLPRRYRPGDSRAAGEDEPADDLVVKLPQPARHQVAENGQQADRRHLVDVQDPFQDLAGDDQHHRAAVMGLGVGRARLVVDQRHFAEVAAAVEKGEGLFPGAGDVLADHHPAFEHHVHLVAQLPLAEDHLVGAELPLLGERGEEVDLQVRELLLLEELALRGEVDVKLPCGFQRGGRRGAGRLAGLGEEL